MESAFRNEVLLKSTRSGRVGEARRIAVANPGTAAVLILPRGDSNCRHRRRQHCRPDCSGRLTGRVRFDGDEGVKIKEKNSAVGVIGLSGRSFRLENRIGGMQIFLLADRG